MLGEGSTGPTDTPCDTLVRDGSIRAPCTLRAHRRRGPTTIRAFPTFSSDRGADVLSSNSGNAGRPVRPGVFPGGVVGGRVRGAQSSGAGWDGPLGWRVGTRSKLRETINALACRGHAARRCSIIQSNSCVCAVGKVVPMVRNILHDRRQRDAVMLLRHARAVHGINLGRRRLLRREPILSPGSGAAAAPRAHRKGA